MKIEEVIGKSPIISQTLECKTITPLLMHGKESKKTAQLRVSSFTGLFRYWFRALQSSNSKIVYEEESKLFGGTSKNSIKSPLLVTVTPALSAKDNKYNTRPHAPYKKPQSIVPGFPEDTSFQLHIQTFIKDEIFIDTLFTYAKLSFYLGGFGQRSRRGFGSIEITNNQQPETPEQWLSYIQQLISSVSKLQFKQINNNLLVTKEHRTIRHPQLLGIYIGNGYDTANEALIKINQTSSVVLKKYGPILGDIGGKGKKLSSPLVVSVKRIGKFYYPIVTEVHNTKNPNRYDITKYNHAKRKFLTEVGATY